MTNPVYTSVWKNQLCQGMSDGVAGHPLFSVGLPGLGLDIASGRLVSWVPLGCVVLTTYAPLVWAVERHRNAARAGFVREAEMW